jgi:O-antigen ligase
VAHDWREFKKGGPESGDHATRFGSSLATYRYDYWVVAWHAFEREPLRGIGADNFQKEYLAHGKSYQTPKFPHSVELGVLSETGIVGGLLFLGVLLSVFARLRELSGWQRWYWSAQVGVFLIDALSLSLEDSKSVWIFLSLAVAAAAAARETVKEVAPEAPPTVPDLVPRRLEPVGR